MKRYVSSWACLALLLVGAGQANAALITGSVWAPSQPAATNATIANQPAGPADVTFTENSGTAMNFRSNGFSQFPFDDYSINTFLTHGGPVTYTSGATFANTFNSLNNAYFLFTGSVFLNAGSNALAITHDDGVQLKIDTVSGFPIDSPGTTPPITSNGTANVASAGFYNFTLSYGESVGPPAVLEFKVNGNDVISTPTPATPEPSTMISGAIGVLAGLGWGWNRRRRAKVAA